MTTNTSEICLPYYLATSPEFNNKDVEKIWNKCESWNSGDYYYLKKIDVRKDISNYHYQYKASISLNDALYDIWKTVDCPYKMCYHVNPNNEYNPKYEMVPITKYIYFVISKFRGAGMSIFEDTPEELEWIISTYGHILHICHWAVSRRVPHGALNKDDIDYWKCEKCGDKKKAPRKLSDPYDDTFCYYRQKSKLYKDNDRMTIYITCNLCGNEWNCEDFRLSYHCSLSLPRELKKTMGYTESDVTLNIDKKYFDSRSTW